MDFITSRLYAITLGFAIMFVGLISPKICLARIEKMLKVFNQRY